MLLPPSTFFHLFLLPFSSFFTEESGGKKALACKTQILLK